MNQQRGLLTKKPSTFIESVHKIGFCKTITEVAAPTDLYEIYCTERLKSLIYVESLMNVHSCERNKF
jgi:hypothetical protein